VFAKPGWVPSADIVELDGHRGFHIWIPIDSLVRISPLFILLVPFSSVCSIQTTFLMIFSEYFSSMA